MSVSYKQYFEDSLVHQFGPAHRATEADVVALIGPIEGLLRQRGYDDAVVASEIARARQEASELIRERGAAPAPAPPPGAARTRILADDRTRRYIVRALIGLALFLVYVTPLAMFFSEGKDMAAVSSEGSDVALALRISVVDLARDQLTFQIMPSSGPLLGSNGRLLKDITVETDPGSGMISHTFKADLPLTPWTITAMAENGDILEFPFDNYQVDLDIEAQSGGKTLRLKTGLVHVPHGLRATHEESPIEDGGSNVVIHIKRTGTIMFVALLATLSLLLVTSAACLVAWQVVYRGRKIEFSMMVWVAALLFVIPTVRNSLPGSVPPGALIDFLLFFWLQVAAVAAMASLVLTWTRRAGT